MRAREALEMATLGGAACLGRTDIGSLEPGTSGDLGVWSLDGVRFAGAVSDPVEAWLRCGPTSATHTIINGAPVVENGTLTNSNVDEMLRLHHTIAVDWHDRAKPLVG